MRNINNLIDNLTYSETYAVRWLLNNLIKNKGYKFTFTVKEAVEGAIVGDISVRTAIRKLAIAEIITWKQISKDKIHMSVINKATFHNLVKELGVR